MPVMPVKPLPELPRAPQTLLEVIRWRTRHRADQEAVTFLLDGEQNEARLTYGELDRGARAVAARLQRDGMAGERALLLYPPGLQYVTAFVGCLYAGTTAVPAYPPRPNRSLERLESILRSADVAVAIAPASVAAQFQSRLGHVHAGERLKWVVADELEEGLEEAWREPEITPETIAFLQYTSGSTSEPKGVVLTHANLVANSELIRHGFEHYPPHNRGVIWLPPYHDMGLIGGIVQPLYTGFPVTLLSPVHVLQQPLRWLQAVTRWGGTTSGGPDFAYDLCTREITEAERETLDLSTWGVAFCGAEPIRSETLERFAETFAPCGFRWEAFYPCYGLAEATLIASGGVRAAAPVLRPVDRAALERDRIVVVAPGTPGAQTLVGCGQELAGLRIEIVDPESRRRRAADEVGEVWLRGASVAAGYWGCPDLTEDTFGARLADGEGPFLRTGDLGFMHEGELFVTGRRKDLLIIRGRNVYPQDVEATSRNSHPAFARWSAAAFSVAGAGPEGERLVMVQEVDGRRAKGAEGAEMVAVLRRAIITEHELAPAAVVLVERTSLPRTSSGKIKRGAARAAFLDDALRVVHAWREEDGLPAAPAAPLEASGPAESAGSATPTGPAGAAGAVRRTGAGRAEIEAWLAAHVAEVAGIAPEAVDPRLPFVHFGLDSKQAVRMSGRLEEVLGVPVDPTLVYEHPDIASLAAKLAGEAAPAPVPAAPAPRGSPAGEPIAIVGMGCRFPGAPDPAAFWALLTGGVDAVGEVPAERWRVEELYDPDPTVPGKMNTRWGGFLGRLDGFDPLFFGISPREAARMDPQQRLLLEVAWEALEDAGEAPERLAGSRTSVFVGISSNDYGHLQLAASGISDAHAGTGNALSIAANRLSYVFGLRGPSLAVDTACSSSLVALHLGCRSLWSGESERALVGGVNVILSPAVTVNFTKAGFMAPDGRCKAFDARADGYVRGEGCGVVVLKRLADAQAAGDRVYAVVRATAVNQDGRSNGLTAPNPAAQEELLRRAYADAGVSPGQVGYVEAHGTGTALGDPIEARALGAVLAEGRNGAPPCALGSVKTNIGHLEAAAGVAGVIKAALVLRHRTLVPSLHFDTPNPHIPFGELPLRVQSAVEPWIAERRIAGVSSFGFGGTNAHAVLEEAPETEADAPGATEDAGRAHLLPLSARSADALRALAESYRALLAAEREPLADVCYTAAVRRAHLEHRLSVPGTKSAEAASALAEWLSGDAGSGVHAGRREPGRALGIGFVFSGQGSQWAGMGADLLDREPAFRAAAEAVDAEWRKHSGLSLVDALRADEAASPLDQTEVAQPAIFAVQVGLAALYRGWGIEPAWVVGHSVGEIAAAHVAGVLTLEEAVRVAWHRGRLMQRGTGRGGMAAVGLPRDAAAARVARFGGALSVAAENAPGACVLSGEMDALETVLAELAAEGVFAKRLEVGYAFHSRQMEEYQDELSRSLAELRPGMAAVPMVSTVTGRSVAGPELDGAYWARGIRDEVRFAAAVGEAAREGTGAVVEIGPHPVLGKGVREVLEARGRTVPVLGTLRKGRAGGPQLLAALGALYAAGAAVEWRGVYPAGRVVDLPAYPWQRERCWLDPAQLAARGANGNGAPPAALPAHGHPLLGRRLRSPLLDEVVFECAVGTGAHPFLAGHRVQGSTLFPAAGFLELALAGAGQAFGGAPSLEDVQIHEPLVLGEDGAPRAVQLAFDAPAEGAAAFRLFALAEEEGDGGAWRLHAAGRARIGGAGAGDAADPDALLAGAPDEVPVDAYYARLREHGLEYDGAFLGLERVWRGTGQAVGRLRLPAGAPAEGFRLHPSLLDAAFQLVLAALPDEAAAGARGAAYLPVGAQALRVSGPVPARLWSRVRLRPDGGERITADVRLFADDGREVAELVELRLVRVPHGAPGGRDATDAWLHELEWRTQPLPPRAGEPAAAEGAWVLLTDRGGTGEEVAARLEARGERVVRARAGGALALDVAGESVVDPSDPGHLRGLFEALDAAGIACRGVVHLWGLDAAIGDDADAAAVEASQDAGIRGVQSLIQGAAAARADAPRLVLVTRGAQAAGAEAAPVALGAAPLWGLGRVIALEMPALRCLRVDLDPAPDPSAGEALVAELDAEGAEDQVAFRGGERRVPRLVRRRAARRGPDGRLRVPDGPYALDIRARGILDELELRPSAREAPGPGAVEVRVAATGLNFRDVMNALGLYPGDAGRFGGEFAGTVEAVGEGVQGVRPGDRVMGVGPGCFGAYVVTRAELVAPVPEGMGFDEAAGIPVAFLTAHHALNRLGGMRAGERVLVHAAAGGVGMAAVQLALRAGAQVIGTAGSAEKRALLRELGVAHVFDSRSLAFAEGIREATGGEGVDLVLNSLAGDFISPTFGVLRPGGRFLEIGKVDIWDEARVAALDRGIDYHVIDLAVTFAEDPALIRDELAELLEGFRDGSLRPLPHRVFPLPDVSAAFRHMAQAKHVGKIVVSHALPAAAGGAVHADAAYLVTGGLGALGLRTARWLVERGARTLVLTGRGEPSPAAAEAIAGLEAAGARIVAVRADVSRADDVARLLAETARLAPLRGVVHAAGVLDDALLVQQAWERARGVLAPKVLGAWNLHAATRGAPLDFFVLYSSAAALLGSPGQGAYAAANAFLDALAHHRRARGLPALSVNWGPWAGEGMAGGVRPIPGLRPLDPEHALKALERLLRENEVQAAVLAADWGELARRVPGRLPAFLEEVSGGAGAAAAGPSEFLAALYAAPPARRRALVGAHLREQVGRVLGLDASVALDEEQGLFDLGMDSLMAVELKNRLEASVGHALPATIAFDYPTLGTLAGFLAGEIVPGGDASAAPEAGAPAETTGQLVEEIRALSDDELAALIDAELKSLIDDTPR